MPRRRSEWEVAHRRRLLERLVQLAHLEAELGLDAAMERLGLPRQQRKALQEYLRRRGLAFRAS